MQDTPFKLSFPLLACLFDGMAQSAHGVDWSLTTVMDYSTGCFGGSAATEIWYVPVTPKLEGERSTVKITLPWVRISSPGGGALIDVDTNGQPIYDGVGARVTQEGMGDAALSYSWSVRPQPRGGFLLNLLAKAKLATADEAKGLGSGRNDYAEQADLYYLAGALTPFATLGYRMPGDPGGLNLSNQWFGTLGLGYKLSTQNSASLMWDRRQPGRPGADGGNEVTFYWVRKLGPNYKVQVYAVRGFSRVSADWGMGIMAGVLF